MDGAEMRLPGLNGPNAGNAWMVKHSKTLLNALIFVVAVTLATSAAYWAGRTDQKLITQRMEALEKRQEAVEKRQLVVEATLTSLSIAIGEIKGVLGVVLLEVRKDR